MCGGRQIWASVAKFCRWAFHPWDLIWGSHWRISTWGRQRQTVWIIFYEKMGRVRSYFRRLDRARPFRRGAQTPRGAHSSWEGSAPHSSAGPYQGVTIQAPHKHNKTAGAKAPCGALTPASKLWKAELSCWATFSPSSFAGASSCAWTGLNAVRGVGRGVRKSFGKWGAAMWHKTPCRWAGRGCQGSVAFP